MGSAGPDLLMPCGTRAAARRHYRRSEPLCEECRRAESRRRSATAAGEKVMDRRQNRNGLPVVPGYRYRARYYPQAAALIAAAEAEHGPPEPTCVCGTPVRVGSSGRMTTCEACGRSPRDAV